MVPSVAQQPATRCSFPQSIHWAPGQKKKKRRRNKKKKERKRKQKKKMDLSHCRHPSHAKQRMIIKTQTRQEGGDPSQRNNKKCLFSFLLLHSHGERGSRESQSKSSCTFPRFTRPRGQKRSKEKEGSNVSLRAQLHNFGVRLCLSLQPVDPSGSY